MKKLLGVMIAIMIFAVPMIVRAQVEANAGSMKIGVHADATWAWSGQSKKDLKTHDLMTWQGYNSVTLQDLFVELTGKVGDRVSYKVLEGLVWESTAITNPNAETINIQEQPYLLAAPLEAYIDFKIIDQLKFRFGKQLIPTLLANTGVHDMDVVHTALQPLIAENSSSSGPVGLNELIWGGATLFAFPKVPLPLSVTGASAVLSFSGLEISYTWYDNWLTPSLVGGPNPSTIQNNMMWGDAGYDFNKTKGGDVALTYRGQLGPGKLAARFFYFDENTDLIPDIAVPTLRAENSGWGLGAMYNADKFFLGAEYTADTLAYDHDIYSDTKSNTWSGYYVEVGGKFGSIQPVYRLDDITYGNQKDKNVMGGKDYGNKAKTEMWNTIGVNYIFNDQVTVGLDYVIKSPTQMKKTNDPNTSELILITELDLL